MWAVILCGATALSLLVAGSELGHAQQLSSDGSVPGMKIVVQDLKRDEGGTVSLRFQLINESGESLPNCAFRENPRDPCTSITGVHLIDAGNKKKYLVVRDAEKKCVCSETRGGKKVENHWAKFAAPPANVQRITVVVPHFQPVENVPITGP